MAVYLIFSKFVFSISKINEFSLGTQVSQFNLDVSNAFINILMYCDVFRKMKKMNFKCPFSVYFEFL